MDFKNRLQNYNFFLTYARLETKKFLHVSNNCCNFAAQITIKVVFDYDYRYIWQRDEGCNPG